LYTEPSAYDVADDEEFAAAMARSQPFVGAVFLGQTAIQATTWPEYLTRPSPWLGGVDVWLNQTRAEHLVEPGAAFPVPVLASNATLVANVNDAPDRDGVFRRATLFRVFDGVAVPSLGLAAFRAAFPDTPIAIEDGRLRLGQRALPVDDDGRITLRFRGPLNRYALYSAAAIIQSELRLKHGEPAALSPEIFKNSYVFFGFSAPGLKDLRPTPVAGDYPGVGIHVTMLDNLLEADALADPPGGWVALLALLMAVLGAAGTLYSRKAWQSTAAFVVVMLLPVGIGFAAYAMGWWWPMAVGMIAALLALISGVIVSYATEGRQKRFIKSAFKQYLGETVIDDIIADPSRLKLGGEKKELTMFFSDLEKFSSFSEKLDPPQLIELLNVYLSDVGRILMEEGAYLDKFIGDAIVAFWNAPVPQPDHARRAVRAALRCQRLLIAKQADYSARAAGMPMRMRIGVNSGEVVVGNMGSADRFNYTMLGDAANLASRLEGANKAFGTFLMVAESTWQQVDGAMAGRELGLVRVVGRKNPVRVFEPLTLPGEPVPAWLPTYEKGLVLVRARQWADAAVLFSSLTGDVISGMYATRCRALAEGAEADWDGVWNLTEK
jgi:adenylate cyclase